jgi:hypothetical protein
MRGYGAAATLPSTLYGMGEWLDTRRRPGSMYGMGEWLDTRRPHGTLYGLGEWLDTKRPHGSMYGMGEWLDTPPRNTALRLSGLGMLAEVVIPPESQTRPQEAPRGLEWFDVLSTGLQQVPTIVEKLPGAYQAYEAGGGGVRGAVATLQAFGVGTKPNAAAATLQTATQKAVQDAARNEAAIAEMTPWWKKPWVVVAGVAVGGGLLWFATKGR